LHPGTAGLGLVFALRRIFEFQAVQQPSLRPLEEKLQVDAMLILFFDEKMRCNTLSAKRLEHATFTTVKRSDFTGRKAEADQVNFQERNLLKLEPKLQLINPLSHLSH